jgi:hypothetical protein
MTWGEQMDQEGAARGQFRGYRKPKRKLWHPVKREGLSLGIFETAMAHGGREGDESNRSSISGWLRRSSLSANQPRSPGV